MRLGRSRSRSRGRGRGQVLDRASRVGQEDDGNLCLCETYWRERLRICRPAGSAPACLPPPGRAGLGQEMGSSVRRGNVHVYSNAFVFSTCLLVIVSRYGIYKPYYTYIY
jgi:hypothetical protein